MRWRFFQQRLGEQAAEERAIHLHHVGQIQLEQVAERALHGGVVATDVEDGVAAEEVEVVALVEVVEVGALRAGIDVVEADDALHADERGVQVLFMQRVVFAKAGSDEAIKVERHGQGRYAGSRGWRAEKQRADFNRKTACCPPPEADPARVRVRSRLE